MYIRFLLILMFASSVGATQFTAAVSSTQIAAGQTIELQLMLEDARAVQPPDLSELTKDFTIYNQQQYSSYSNTNGTVTSQSGWDLTIAPKHEGKLVIPSIEINSNKGRLRTQEINISVAQTAQPKTSQAAPSPDTNDGVSMIAVTSKAKVYVKEPFVYTLKIITYKGLANITLEDIKSSDAIIDKIGQPKQYPQTLGGLRAHVIEIKYHVTPLVAGNIVISPAVIHGEMQEMTQTHRTNRFGLMSSIMFDNPFTMKPFKVQGDKLIITALEPAVKTANWLPLQNLNLSEEWSNLTKVKVGDSIRRKIKMVANGSYSNQLPSLKQFVDVAGLKIYADKPNLSDSISPKNDMVTGTKEEIFSIVPQQPGNLTLPEIKIHWWNLRTNQPEVAILAARTIEVLPGAAIKAKDTVIDYSNGEQPKTEAVVAELKQNWWLYGLVTSLVIIILALMGFIIYLIKRKPAVAIKATVTANKVYSQKQITSTSDLRDEMLNYAHKTWQAPKTLPLTTLGDFLSAAGYSYDLGVYTQLSTQLNAAIYAGAQIDLASMIILWEQFKRSVSKNRISPASRKANDLNPT